MSFRLKNAVIWVNYKTRSVDVTRQGTIFDSDSHWVDPIGASYVGWHDASNDQRIKLMLETCVELAIEGFNMAEVLRTFAKIKEFRALADESYPMYRVLSKAFLGHAYEPHPEYDSFDDFLERTNREESVS